MTIHLYTISWNEMDMLGFFFRHYESWVDRFVVYDDGSTDGTLDDLHARPNVEVRSFPYSHPDSFVHSQQTLQNHAWKQSRGRADWVIVTAIDEHLYHPSLLRYLASCRESGVTCIPALGFSMIADSFPDPGEHLATTRTLGAPDSDFAKLRIFNPDAIQETNFAPGGHGAAVEGHCVLPERDELMLLHYKDLGDAYVAARNAALGARLGRADRVLRFGWQYARTDAQRAEWQQSLRARAVDVRDPSYFPWIEYREKRWWR